MTTCPCQALHTQLEPAEVTVVTIALNLDPAKARPWIKAAAPTHPGFAPNPDAVASASQPRSADHSRAAACFEIGWHLHEQGHEQAAVAWWKQAHALFPENWTHKRQAWTLASMPHGADSDKAQEVDAVFVTSWSEEFVRTDATDYSITPDL